MRSVQHAVMRPAVSPALCVVSDYSPLCWVSMKLMKRYRRLTRRPLYSQSLCAISQAHTHAANESALPFCSLALQHTHQAARADSHHDIHTCILSLSLSLSPSLPPSPPSHAHTPRLFLSLSLSLALSRRRVRTRTTRGTTPTTTCRRCRERERGRCMVRCPWTTVHGMGQVARPIA